MMSPYLELRLGLGLQLRLECELLFSCRDLAFLQVSQNKSIFKNGWCQAEVVVSL